LPIPRTLASSQVGLGLSGGLGLAFLPFVLGISGVTVAIASIAMRRAARAKDGGPAGASGTESSTS
jgi:hypothetical protein